MRVVVDELPEKCKACPFFGAYRFETASYHTGQNRYGCILLKEELKTKNQKKMMGCPLVPVDKVFAKEEFDDDRK